MEKNLVPMHQRGSTIMLPTPENIDRVTAEAAAKRAREADALRHQPVNLARKWGIQTELADFLQRQEALVLELQRRIAVLEAADRSSLTPPHMRNVEKR